jgi:hypothetical protein
MRPTVEPKEKAESGVRFSAALEELGHTQASFVRWLMENGDPRGLATLQRYVGRMVRGEAAASGEMWVLLELLKRQKADAAATPD